MQARQYLLDEERNLLPFSCGANWEFAMDEKNFDAKRRNLIFASFFLVFIKYADAEINNSATVSFLKVQIGNPEAIVHALWVMWFYFLLRAYQHYAYYMRADYQRSLQKISVPLMHRYVAGAGIPEEHDLALFDDIERFHKYKLVFRPQFFVEQFAALFLRLKKYVFGPQYPKSKRINLLRKPNLQYLKFVWRAGYGPGDAWRVIVWTVTDRSYGGAGKMPLELVARIGMPFSEGLYLKARVQLAMILKSAPFFECRVPFILAAFPVIYYGVDFLKKMELHGF